VIEEPTAAAVAYDLHKKSNVHHILVYDFGGGTLDVSLLYVAKGSVQVYATDGDDELGGSDLDMCLFDIISSKVSLSFSALSCVAVLSCSVLSLLCPTPLTLWLVFLSPFVSLSPQITAASSGTISLSAGSDEAHEQEEYREEGKKELCVGPVVRQKAEQVKKALSSADTVPFSCLLTPTQLLLRQGEGESKGQRGTQGTGAKIDLMISREDFHG
jgi:hypothetical protein